MQHSVVVRLSYVHSHPKAEANKATTNLSILHGTLLHNCFFQIESCEGGWYGRPVTWFGGFCRVLAHSGPFTRPTPRMVYFIGLFCISAWRVPGRHASVPACLLLRAPRTRAREKILWCKLCIQSSETCTHAPGNRSCLLNLSLCAGVVMCACRYTAGEVVYSHVGTYHTNVLKCVIQLSDEGRRRLGRYRMRQEVVMYFHVVGAVSSTSGFRT